MMDGVVEEDHFQLHYHLQMAASEGELQNGEGGVGVVEVEEPVPEIGHGKQEGYLHQAEILILMATGVGKV